MHYPYPLLPGRLLKRYKRFLADIELESGEQITAHCPNTGSMQRCCEPDSRVWVFHAPSPKRKLAYTWELVEVDGQYLANINTGRANALVKEAIVQNRVPELSGYNTLQSEVRYGQENSRIDLRLQQPGRVDCYVEVKNVTLLNTPGEGLFPDAVTLRGQKHLRELAKMAQQGFRAVLFFNVAHTGIDRVCPARTIDPDYANALEQAINNGVEILVYRTDITPEEITLNTPLPFLLK